ncbi:MAG: hypothetical protein HQL81_13745 [Magnetococcales bacterium]|nr:hypothetical protein [Magnetococcales bacterium]
MLPWRWRFLAWGIPVFHWKLKAWSLTLSGRFDQIFLELVHPAIMPGCLITLDQVMGKTGAGKRHPEVHPWMALDGISASRMIFSQHSHFPGGV